MDRKTARSLLQDMIDSTEQLCTDPAFVEAMEMGKIALNDAEARHPQRQDALNYQLESLHTIANVYGLYDAADWIKATLGGRDYGL